MSKIGDEVIRKLEEINEEDIEALEWPIEDEHDCHLVGGGGESGCSHPSHDL